MEDLQRRQMNQHVRSRIKNEDESIADVFNYSRFYHYYPKAHQRLIRCPVPTKAGRLIMAFYDVIVGFPL